MATGKDKSTKDNTAGSSSAKQNARQDFKQKGIAPTPANTGAGGKVTTPQRY